MEQYWVFCRRWWKDNPAWPNGLEPHPRARKRTLGYAATEEEARAMCARYAGAHPPGRYSVKPEYLQLLPRRRRRP